VFWAAVLALLFEPMYLRLVVRMGGRRNLAALTTIAVILVMVILPVILVSFSLVREAAGLYHRIKSGQLDLGSYFSHFIAVLPAWATELLAWLGVDDLGAAQAKLTAAITQRSQALTFARARLRPGRARRHHRLRHRDVHPLLPAARR
jgi:predicted PurR-regulated permease PerM